MAASPFRGTQAKTAMLIALPALAASGAPSIAVTLGLVGAVVCHRSAYESAREFSLWVLASTALGIVTALLLGAWGWRLGAYGSSAQVIALLKQLAWFSWPAWPLALWTLWRWRQHLLHRHISVPLSCAIVSLVACIAMGGSDRALMLGLPNEGIACGEAPSFAAGLGLSPRVTTRLGWEVARLANARAHERPLSGSNLVDRAPAPPVP